MGAAAVPRKETSRQLVEAELPTHMRPMDWADFLTFASEAEIVGLWGLALLCMAAFALLAEKRRNKTARFDRVGWMPWTPIFMFSAMIGAGLLALAAKGIVAG